MPQESSPLTSPFANALRRALQAPLPGPEAQLRLAPVGRSLPREGTEHLAAVLVAFYRENGVWRFPLIHRVEDGYVHGGQVGLPGGHKEGDETPEQTALREAHEEIGLEPERVTLVGRLSPLPIPVSRTRVQVIVGVADAVPQFQIDPEEVQDVLVVDVEELLNPTNLRRERWTLRNSPVDVPLFALAGHKVWGATAMMLSELREVLGGGTLR